MLRPNRKFQSHPNFGITAEGVWLRLLTEVRALFDVAKPGPHWIVDEEDVSLLRPRVLAALKANTVRPYFLRPEPGRCLQTAVYTLRTLYMLTFRAAFADAGGLFYRG